jgi:hypothetical protein
MNNITNVYIDSTSSRAIVMRDGTSRSRRFLHTKFGGKKLATKKAAEYAQYLHNCPPDQFFKAVRSVGRPLKSEFFGRRIIAN